MRYVKLVGDSVIEYSGSQKRPAFYRDNGFLSYEGNLPVSRLNIVNNKIFELPEPGPSAEQIAAETYDKLQKEQLLSSLPVQTEAETIKKLAPLYPKWTAGETYSKGKIVFHDGELYVVIQPSVLAMEHQPPGSVGLESVYQVIDGEEHAGTFEDPIPWKYNLNVKTGLYYALNGKIYVALRDLPFCTWKPSDEGMQGIWEEQATI